MSAEPLRLHRGDLEALADLIADRLAAKLPAVPARGELLTAAQVAERFHVDRGWVYSNADRLAVIRLGTGAKPRLRFDPERVAESLAPREEGRGALGPDAAPRHAARRRAARTAPGGSPLLPIRGVAAPEIGGVE